MKIPRIRLPHNHFLQRWCIAQSNVRSLSLNRKIIAIGLVLLSSVVGCAKWYPNLTARPNDTKKENTFSLPPGHIAIQTIFLRLDPQDSPQLDSLWPMLEELSFDFELRQRLDTNGIRCGVIVGEIPPEIQRWIDRAQTRLSDDPLETLGANADVQTVSNAMYFKNGVEKDLVVKPMRTGQLVVMHHENGGGGKTYVDPALLFHMRGEQKDNGAITLQLEPVIEHGQFKNHIVGEEFAMRRETKRDTQHWPDLKITRDLRDGQYLILSSTQPPRALGQHFFMSKLRDGSDARVVLLVRVNKSRSDSAFQQ